jgi:outer membrane protein TolC
VRNALSKRTDLESAKKTIEASDVSIKFYRNQIMPQVNLNANYQLTGSGGTVFRFNDDFPPTIASQTQTSYFSVLNTILTNDFPRGRSA